MAENAEGLLAKCQRMGRPACRRVVRASPKRHRLTLGQSIFKRGNPLAKPLILIKWLNLTKKPVKRLSGTVYLYDRAGKLILTK